jgi:hypothetical protein
MRGGTLTIEAPRKALQLLIMVAVAVAVCLQWAPPTLAEIFDGSGFEAISWPMHIGDVERVMGSALSRLRNEHGHFEYLRAANYQYLACEYELLLNFEGKGGTLSSIVLTRHGGAKAMGTEKPCREGLDRLREKIGRPLSVSDGVQMWRLKNTTVTVMESRRGELQIRYTATRPVTE